MDHEPRPERVLEVAVRLQLSAYDAWYLAAAESAWETSFLAGQAFGPYRRAGGSGPRMLADFLIGAHAAVAGFPLITRTHGYKQYFAVEVVDPNLPERHGAPGHHRQARAAHNAAMLTPSGGRTH